MNQAPATTAFSNLTLTSTTKPFKVIWTKEISAIFAIDFLIIALALFFHLLGIVLILTNKSKRNGLVQYEFSNQHLLLLHLSIVSIIGVFINSVAIYHKTHRIRYPQYFIVIYYVAYLAYIINLVYLSFDRLILVLFPLKYRKKDSKALLISALAILWVLAILYGIMMKYAKFINHGGYRKYASFVYNGIVVLVTLLIYVIIICKVNLLSDMNSSKITSKSKKTNIRKYLVPFLIVGTFFLFNIVPAIITSTIKFDRADLILLIGINVLNYVSDPVIYIFIQPSIYKHFIKTSKRVYFKCAGVSQSGSSKSRSFSQTSNLGTINSATAPYKMNQVTLNISRNPICDREDSQTELEIQEEI